MRKLRRGQSCAVGIAGDSTGDKPYEWPALALTKWVGEDFPRVSVDYYEWDGTSAYGTVMPMITGVAGRTTVVRDEFARTAADLVGSTPDVGSAWAAVGNGAGDWSVDGSDAVATSDSSRGVVYTTVPAGDIEVSVTAVVPASQTFRLMVKRVNDSNYLAAYIARNSSGNQYRLQLVKMIGGVQTTVAQSEYFYVNEQIAEEDLSVTVRTAGDRFTGSIMGVHVGGTLASGDVTAVSTSTQVAIWGSAVTGVKVRRFQADRITVSTAGTLTIYNGSKSGTVLSYQQGVIASLYPTATSLDMLLVNSGHNYGSGSAASYLSAMDDFVAAFRGEQATAAIVIASQNPRIDPNFDGASADNVAPTRPATKHCPTTARRTATGTFRRSRRCSSTRSATTSCSRTACILEADGRAARASRRQQQWPTCVTSVGRSRRRAPEPARYRLEQCRYASRPARARCNTMRGCRR